MTAFISGMLGLGTGIANGVLQEPTSYGYSRQPITYSGAPGAIALNANGATFGPSDGTWGTLTAFGIFDLDQNLVFTGTLNQPIATPNGAIITIPVATVQLNLNGPLPSGVVLSGYQTALVTGTGQILGPPSTSGAQPEHLTVGGGLQIAGDNLEALFGTTTGTVADGGALAAETSRAEAAEEANAAAASASQTTANQAAASAQTNANGLAAEVTARANGDTTNATAISNETSRAETAEGVNATAISAETSRAETAEALLAPKASPTFTGTPEAPTASPLTGNTQLSTTAYTDAAVEVEKTRAEATESTLADNLTAETTARESGDAINATAISAETARAEAVEGTLTTALSTEATTRAAADTANANAIATETTRAEGVEAIKAPLASPVLTGTPEAPTASPLTSDTQLATTAYADAATAVEKTRAIAAESTLTAAAAAAQATASAAQPGITAASGKLLTGPSATGGTLGTLSVSTGLTASGGNLAVAYGTAAGTAAQGNDARITGALQGANNLSDVASAATARTNLGLGTAALLAAGGANGAAVLDASGYLSANSFISTGTTTARTLAARGADYNNLKDFGAVLNGTTSDTTAYAAAYAATNNNGTIVIPPGNINAAIPNTTGKSILWQTLGTFDYGTSAPGTNPVTALGNGDVLETFLGGRKYFTKTVTTNTGESFATVEVAYIDSSTTAQPGIVHSALNVTATNNSTNSNGPGVWSLNISNTVNGAASDNYGFGCSTTIATGATAWGACGYMQLFDNPGTSGDINVHEFDLFTTGLDPIGTAGPNGGLRSIGNWNLALNPNVSAATAQSSRGLSVGGNASGVALGSIYHSSANFYCAGLDLAQATLLSGYNAAGIALAPNMPIDFSRIYSTGALNTRTLGYNSTAGALQYVAPSGAMSISDAGIFSADGILNTPISGSTGSFTTLAASGAVSGAGFTALLAPYATSSSVTSTLASYAPLASPALTGTPTAPTPGVSTNTTQLSTAAHVLNVMASPPAIGATASNSGAFTVLTFNGDAPGNGAANISGTYAVGFDTANATLSSSALRMAAGQTIGFESTSTYTLALNSLTFQFKNGSTVLLGIADNGNVTMESGAALQIGSAYTATTITPTGYITIIDSSGTVRKIPCM